MSKLNISNLDLKYLNFNIKEFKSQGYTYYRIQKQLDKNNKVNVTGKSKEEVKEKYFNKLEEFLNKDIANLDINNMTFSEFVSYYLFEVVLPSGSVKAKTFTSYEIIYRNRIKDSIISNIKLIELKREHLQKYFNNLLNTNLKLSTIKAVKGLVSIVLNYAVNEDYILKNYCSSIKLPNKTEDNKLSKYLTDEEISLIFENCKDKRLLIFTNKNFKPLYSNLVDYHLKKLFKKCNINVSGFHIFRHTSGSKLYEMGVNIKTISEQLGHSNTNITSNIYVHLDEEKKKEAIKHLDKYFKSV